MHQVKFNLTWHTYSDSLRTMMQEMMMSEDFADVTLITNDKKLFKGHRNILSACSPVFKNIFQMESHSNNHPVIYLRGIEYSEIESIMQFIYMGETAVYEDRMHEFQSVAKNLEIKELNENIENCLDNQADSKRNKKSLKEEMKVISDEQNASSIESFNDQKEQNIGNEANRISSKFECLDCNKTYKREIQLRIHIKSIHEGVKFSCPQCDKQFTQQSNLTVHIKSAHQGVKYPCKQCDFQANQQGNLTAHIKTKHEGVRHECDLCDFKSTRRSFLLQHIQSQHEEEDHRTSSLRNLTAHVQSKHEGIIKHSLSEVLTT